MRLIVAVDGPAASGKGTIAKKLAEYFNLSYLDTGILYRAVALQMLTDGLNEKDTRSDLLKQHIFLCLILISS